MTTSTTEAAGPDRSGRGAVIRSLPFVAIYLVTLVVNLGFSLREGRLASVPTFDDVGYLADALNRVVFAEGHGLWSPFASFWWDAPHAPISTLTAMLGFWAFGPNPASAYIANGWVLALYIFVLARISRPLRSLLARGLFVAVLAYVPAAHAMVTEFRPDMAGGLLFALAVYAMVTTDFRSATWRDRLVLVVVAACATIMKPSAIVLTIPALGVAFAAALVAQGLFTRPEKGRLIRGGLVCVLLYALALVPFFIVFGGQTISYISDVLFKDADIWTTPGDRWFHWTYHWSGPGAKEAIGDFRRPLIAFLIVDIILYIRYPVYRRPGVIPFYVTMAVVFCAMAISREKTTFQGSYFYLPLVLAGAAAFVRIAAAARSRWDVVAPFFTTSALSVCLGLAVLFLPLGGAYFPRAKDGPEAISLMPRMTDAIFALNKNEWFDSQSCRDHLMRIVVTNYDPLTAEAIQMALAEGGVQVRPEYVFFTRSLQEALEVIDRVDLVVMVDPGAVQTQPWLPVTKLVPDIFKYLSNQPGVRRIEVGTYRQKPYWLFVKPHCEPFVPPA